MKKISDLSTLSDEDILRERGDLLVVYNKNLAHAKSMVSRLARLKEELNRRRNKQEKPYVTDHAVVRYLERVEGLDIEAVREFLLNHIPIDAEINEHNSLILKNFILKMSKDGKAVTTVITKEMMDEGSIQAERPPSKD